MKSETKQPKNSKSLQHIMLLCCCLLLSFLLKAQTRDTVLGKKYYDESCAAARDYKSGKAYRFMLKSSDAGYTEADKSLAQWYNNRYGQKGSPQLVFKYTKKAAEAGDFEYMRLLAYYYADGRGTKKDLEAALAWYKIGISLGDVLAKLDYCAFYFNKEQGNDPEKGYVFQQEKDSLFAVAFINEDALNGSPEKEKCQTYYRLLSDAGYGKASYRLGKIGSGYSYMASCYTRAIAQGYPVPQQDIDYVNGWIVASREAAKTNPMYYDHTKVNTTNKSQKVCPFCHGVGSTVSASSKGIEQDKNGRWYNTYTPSSLSSCSYCHGTGYY